MASKKPTKKTPLKKAQADLFDEIDVLVESNGPGHPKNLSVAN